MSGRGTVLGCAGRTCARVRVLTLGVQRVDLVAELKLTAAGASRHDAHAFLLQEAARDEARLHTNEHARRGGVPRGSAGRRPSMEHAGCALDTAVLIACATSPHLPGAASW
jgi:hypothetical protein